VLSYAAMFWFFARPGGVAPLPVEQLMIPIAQIALVAVARIWPKARDAFHVAIGIAVAVYVIGWPHTVALSASAMFIFFVMPRVPSWPAMLVTAGLLVGVDSLLPRLASMAPVYAIGWAYTRMFYYAYELRSIPRASRSLTRLLAYGPFNILLWPGLPPMLSYQTYHAQRPASDRDRLGRDQLLRGTVKMLAAFIIVPKMLAFSQPYAPVAEVLQFMFIPYISGYLAVSGSCDMATGISNLAGYHAPDSFDSPLLAPSPIHMWTRWNVHVMYFLRQAFIFPVLRWRRKSMALAVAAGMAGTTLLHSYFFLHMLRNGHHGSMTVRELLVTQGELFVFNVALLVLFIPLHARVDKWPRPARVLMIVITQIVAAATMGGRIPFLIQ
jgi:hypothetical protein